jgi:hypothetical protein
MKRFISLCVLLTCLALNAQDNERAFKSGEFLKYKIQYGLLNAGFATVELRDHIEGQDSLIRATGKGWTTGMVGFLFSVEDLYESYFSEDPFRPKHFVRKINEGGYTQDKEIFFDYKTHYAKVINHKKKTETSHLIQNNIQDMMSSFYYMRSLDFSNLQQNDSIAITMFFDGEMHPFRLIIMDREPIKTKFGIINTIKIRPIVQKGRVFQDEENVTLWISDDENKIPVKIKASLLVGSAKAELFEYRGLVHPFP